MIDGRTTRRNLLAASGAALALGVLAGCGGGPGQEQDGPVEIFALSGRGRRISNAAKKHNANKRFVSFALADANHAHPGDTSQVVSLMVSRAEFRRLFGLTGLVSDLRHV